MVVIIAAPKRPATKNSSTRTLSHLRNETLWLIVWENTAVPLVTVKERVTITFLGNALSKQMAQNIRFIQEIQKTMGVFRVAETANEEKGTLGFLEDDEMLIWGPWGRSETSSSYTRAATSAHAAKSKKPDCEALE